MNQRLKKTAAIIWTATNIVVALMLLVSGYGGTIAPSVSVIPSLLLMGFPGFIALWAVTLFADLLTTRRKAWIQIAAAALCAGPLLSYCPLHFIGNTPDEEERTREIKLLSYNVRSFMTSDCGDDGPFSFPKWSSSVNYIYNSGADIVCMQEAMSLYELNYHFPAQTDSLLRLYPYRADNPNRFTILSRYPFKTIDLRQPSSPTAFFMAVELDIDSVPLTLFTVHLQSLGLSSDDKELYEELSEGKARHNIGKARSQLLGKLASAFRQRELQAKLLREQIDSIAPENVVVAGDFNDIAGCYAMRVIEGDDMRDAYAATGLGPIITYHAHRFYFHIDHILLGETLTPVSTDKGTLKTSDHYPVAATFLLPAR